MDLAQDDQPPDIARTKLILYLVVLGVYSLVVLTSLILFLRLRHLPAFYYRSVPLTLAITVCNFLLTALLLVREAVPATPCLLSFWVLAIVPPLYVALLSGRFIQLAVRYRVSEAALIAVKEDGADKKKQVKAGGRGFKRGIFSKKRHQAPDLDFVPGEAKGKKKKQEVELVANMGSWHVSDHPRNVTNRAIILYTLFFLLLYIGVLIAYEAMIGKKQATTSFMAAQVLCARSWSQLPQYSFIAFCLFILIPSVIYSLAGVNDAYGIRTELVATVILGIGMTIAYGVASIYDARFPNLLPPEVIMCVALLFMHWMMVVQPVLSHYWSRRRLGSLLKRESDSERATAKAGLKRAFGVLLSDPLLFEEFKMFTVKDFSVENALFYEETVRIRASNLDQATLSKELLRVYHLFISPVADYPLNLKAATMRTIRERVKNNQLAIDLYNDALAEVVQLMQTDTFVRFLRSKHEEYKQDLMLRADAINE